MIEVTQNEAMAGSWKEFSTPRRINLLKYLEVEKDHFNRRISLKEVAQVDDWWKLPIPLRTFLERRFMGGAFTKETHQKHMAAMQVNIAAMDRAEHDYENGPDV